jgi:hypothetical protein
MDHGRDIGEMARGIDILVFYECEESTWIIIVQITNRGPGHVVDRWLAVFFAFNLEAHLSIAEQAEKFAT